MEVLALTFFYIFYHFFRDINRWFWFFNHCRATIKLVRVTLRKWFLIAVFTFLTTLNFLSATALENGNDNYNKGALLGSNISTIWKIGSQKLNFSWNCCIATMYHFRQLNRNIFNSASNSLILSLSFPSAAASRLHDCNTFAKTLQTGIQYNPDRKLCL